MYSGAAALMLAIYGFNIFGAIIFMIVSLATNYWLVVTQSFVTIHSGLFEACAQDKCISFDEYKAKSPIGRMLDYSFLDTTKGLCFAAVVLQALTLLVIGHLAYLFFIAKSQLTSKNHGIITLFVAFAGGVLAVAAGVYYVVETNDSGSQTSNAVKYYSFSMYLAIGSGGQAFSAGVFAIISNYLLFRSQQLMHQQPQQMQPQVAGFPPGQSVTYVHAPSQQYPNYHPGTQPAAVNTAHPTQAGNVAPTQQK